MKFRISIAANPTNMHQTYLCPCVELPCIADIILRQVCLQ